MALQRQPSARPPRTARPPEGRCAACGKRPADTWFDASGIAGHGFEAPWCEVCVLEKQIPFARERAAILEQLEARYEELTGERLT